MARGGAAGAAEGGNSGKEEEEEGGTPEGKDGAEEGRGGEQRADKKMLFSFKNKYHYTYPNTYIALYSRTPKLPVTHTHPQKQEIVVHPS